MVDPPMNPYGQQSGYRQRVSPVFLGILALVGISGWLCWTEVLGANGTRFAVFAFVMLGWIASLCVHEYGHARVALWGGDRSVIGRGYLTLNPAKYLQRGLSLWMPLLFLAIGGIGLPGGAVWINHGAIRTPLQRSLMSLAGPGANLLLGSALASLLRLLNGSVADHAFFMGALAYLALLQFFAAFLNLVPFPGFDGFGAIEPFLGESILKAIEPIRRFSLFLMIVVVSQSRGFSDLVFGNAEKALDAFGIPTEGASQTLAAFGRAIFRSVISLN